MAERGMRARCRARRHGLVVALVALVALFSTTRAVAAPSARLVFVRDADAASCPDEAAVRAAVAARLGYDPFVAYARATMFAEVRRSKGAYVVSIRLVDENNVVRGARELDAPGDRCADIIDAMALSMSIAIDPLSLGRESRPADQAPPEDPSPVVASAPPEAATPSGAADPPAPRERVPDAVTTPPDDGTHLEAAVGPSLWFGSAPAPAAGVRANVMLRGRRIGALIDGRLDLPSSAEVSPSGSVRTSLVFGSLGVCGFADPVFVCALGSVGRLSASADGIAAPHATDAFHAAAGARVGASLSLGGALFARAEADLDAVLTPHRLEIGGKEVYSLPPVAIGGAIVAGFRFF